MKNLDAYDIYINEDSGTVQQLGHSAIEKLVSESDINVHKISFLQADKLLAQFKNHDGENPVLIGGGDGTIRSCAKRAIKTNRGFGILPFGTMNLMARDLDIPVQIDAALRAYANGSKTVKVDIGYVNQEPFLCCAGLGTMPETSQLREQHRGDSSPLLMFRLMTYMLERMDKQNHIKLNAIMDGKTLKISTSALVVSNNQYGPQGLWTQGNFRRESLQDGVLGIYSAAPRSILEKIRLLARLPLGNWKDDHALKEWQCKNIILDCDELSVLLSLDGEPKRFKPPLDFKIDPAALNICVPRI